MSDTPRAYVRLDIDHLERALLMPTGMRIEQVEIPIEVNRQMLLLVSHPDLPSTPEGGTYPRLDPFEVTIAIPFQKDWGFGIVWKFAE